MNEFRRTPGLPLKEDPRKEVVWNYEAVASIKRKSSVCEVLERGERLERTGYRISGPQGSRGRPGLVRGPWGFQTTCLSFSPPPPPTASHDLEKYIQIQYLFFFWYWNSLSGSYHQLLSCLALKLRGNIAHVVVNIYKFLKKIKQAFLLSFFNKIET